ncbi:GlcG/HbpS family heme-binding protein [Streptantibioticus ferralitis]|uniref:Heme-binding protein n=1 Tax=Streptantibioticus ferralitis TaxID=236510 RepID=A0ABT5ZBD9_9ACTN|nr:heme-binding protein [Streptantibioticus ferralitis]MDF2261155.1 heme-binding protein [Streptantibioticus ferralitis]
MTNAPLTKSTSAASVTLEAANALIQAVQTAAAEIGFEASVAVTDGGGHLKAFQRTDSTPFLASEVALDKAWTAASFGYPTHVWNNYLADPNVAPLAHHPRLMAVGGGYPILEDGKLIGGLGISGGTYEQDQQAAEAALKVLGFELPA